MGIKHCNLSSLPLCISLVRGYVCGSFIFHDISILPPQTNKPTHCIICNVINRSRSRSRSRSPSHSKSRQIQRHRDRDRSHRHRDRGRDRDHHNHKRDRDRGRDRRDRDVIEITQSDMVQKYVIILEINIHQNINNIQMIIIDHL